MGNIRLRRTRWRMLGFTFLMLGFCFLFSAQMASGQVDQGAINGVVKDPSGALIAGAQVTLTNTDTNFPLHGKSDAKGEYSFSPIKIGNYTVSASAPGFETTTQENVVVNIQDRLNIDITLKPGGANETVTVTGAPPMLQSETASVGQVMDTETINNTPLNGRNWVYIAQLAAGVDPAVNNLGRGAGTGDFAANGQRTTQNNFILDGVDNNVDADDLMNGASYNVRPPPDALAEFKIDTSNYSAEFGHAAGAVLNASIKAGSNQFHGDLWEYVRNTKLDAADWDNGGEVPPYHENQFGATLGAPLWKNKLFYFGDAEANRITFGFPDTGLTVPTPLMRVGNFTELFNGSLTSSGNSIAVFGTNPTTGAGSAGYYPLTNTSSPSGKNVSAGQIAATPPPGIGIAGNGQQTTNILSPGEPLAAGGTASGQMDTVTSELMNDFPMPNANGWDSSALAAGEGGKTFANYHTNLPVREDTWQWDQRLDWNISPKDQTYARFSYSHQQTSETPALGPILDGGSEGPGFNGGEVSFNMGQGLMFSETHIFNPSLINEFRYGFNWGNFQALQFNPDVSAATLVPGLYSLPISGGNGGLPFFNTSDLSHFGAPRDLPSIERQNVYQFLDNVTKVWGKHSLKFGVQLEAIRASISQPYCPRGIDHFATIYSSQPNAYGYNPNSNQTGWGVADMFTDNMANTQVSPNWNTEYYRWYRAGYAQDDWKVNSRLTVNIGLRYDNFQPISNKNGDIANIVIHSAGIGIGSATYVEPTKVQGNLSASFINELAVNNVNVQYVNSTSLVTSQKLNFAPRLGIAFQVDPLTVVRSGFGLFYGGIEVPGASELTDNYPFGEFYAVVYNSTNCEPPVAAPGYTGAPPDIGTCNSTAEVNNNPNYLPSLPYTTSLETGMGNFISAASGNIANLVNGTSFNMEDTTVHTPYTMGYNLTIERQLSKNMVASMGYVGNMARHLYNAINSDGAYALTNPNINYSLTYPFPSLGMLQSSFNGVSMYNSLQTKIQKRYSDGLSYLATYTWAHATDNSSNPGIGVGPGLRSPLIIPINDDVTNSSYDVRHRVTVNGQYELPFGRGRKWAHEGGVLDYLVGGWQTSLTWQAQTGTPFTVTSINEWDNGTSPNGGNTYAYKIRNPFAGGGTPDPTQLAAGVTSCPATVKNRTNWYNPCAFANPWNAATGPHAIPFPTVPGQPSVADGSAVVGVQNAMNYLGGKSNQVYGPGFERVNMSAFKSFKVWHEQYIQFRADSFNLLNHPSWANPSDDTSNDSGGGDILGAQSFQNLTPDARFFQLSGKYVF